MIEICPYHLKSVCSTCRKQRLMAKQLQSARRMLITAPVSSGRQTCTALHVEPQSLLFRDGWQSPMLPGRGRIEWATAHAPDRDIVASSTAASSHLWAFENNHLTPSAGTTWRTNTFWASEIGTHVCDEQKSHSNHKVVFTIILLFPEGTPLLVGSRGKSVIHRKLQNNSCLY